MIRPVEIADADELAALYAANRDFLAPFDPDRPDAFYTPQGQLERIRGMAERREAGLEYPFAIVAEGRIAGFVNLSSVVRGALQGANVGYWVAQADNGRGLASTAVAESASFAFEELGLHRLQAGTLVDNVASQRVLEKNGFERIGLARRYLHIGGDWRDHILFQRLAEDR